MLSAQLITIGTEITSGEVVNTNASWISLRLEELGIRVYSHLSVRDRREEILKALDYADYPVVIVTGGLGPTSDDITRDCLAVYTKTPLDFDNEVWSDLRALYEKRGLPLREAHRWQCHFPRGSVKLKNGVGTALGFSQTFEGRHYFVLPGPPRELEAMWSDEVQPRLEKLAAESGGLGGKSWLRWTCLGAPESEVAEKVEPVLKLAAREIEVGYRAQVPYVRVKIFADPAAERLVINGVEAALAPWIVARGHEDPAEDLLKVWPDPVMNLHDSLTDAVLLGRMIGAQKSLGGKGPKLNYGNTGGLSGAGVQVSFAGEEFTVKISTSRGEVSEKKTLPYKIPLNSERGKRSAAEWAIWIALCALRARESQP